MTLPALSFARGLSRGSTALALTAFAAILCGSAPASAGFFDFLFPPMQQPQAVAPREYVRPYTRHVHKAPKHPKIIAETHHKPAKVVASVMEDESLKSGDAVMTAEGLRIFRGEAGAAHDAGDFVKIAEVRKGLSSAQRSALLAVDAGASHARGAALLDGRSIAEAGLSQGEVITDARGARIRYVGP